MKLNYDLDAMRASIVRFEGEIKEFEKIVEESFGKKFMFESAKKEPNLAGYENVEQLDELAKRQQEQVDYYKEQVRTKQNEIGEYQVLIRMQEMQDKQ